MIFINSFKWQQTLWATQNSKTLYIVPIIQSTWNHLWHLLTLALPSVLWRCWLGSRKGIRPVKNWAVGCWRVICLEWGADSTGKYRQNKLNTNQKNTAKQNYPGSVAFYNTRPANEVSLFYNAPEPTRGKQSGITAHRKKVTLVYWHTRMLHTEQHSMFIPSLKPLKIWRFLITVRGMVSVCVRTFTPVGLWIAHERLRTCLFVHYIKLHNNSHLYGHW